MATLYVTELRHVETANGESVPLAVFPSVTTQAITISGSSASSAAFNALTRYIRISTDTACHFVISAAGTAATTVRSFLPANSVEYIAVSPAHFITVIAH